MGRVYLITHPDVVIDPNVPITRWPLSARGRERMELSLTSSWLTSVSAVYSSAEQKAMDGATIIARHLGIDCAIIEDLGEIDRSSTGYLPHAEHAATAQACFARPDESVRGWERATDAQQRIARAIERIIAEDRSGGDIAIVSHGGVAALYLCRLKGRPISLEEGQPGQNGGNYFCFDAQTSALVHGWQSIDGPGASAADSLASAPAPQIQLQMIWPERLLDAPPPLWLPPGYVLRTYRPGDESRWFQLMESAGWPGWDAARLRSVLVRILPAGWFLVVHEASGEIVASAMSVHDYTDLHPFGGELSWVAGDPAHAGKGLGMVVCAAVTSRLIAAGYRDIHLYTDDWRLPALKSYLKLGYVPFLFTPEMPDRWRAICAQLGWPFTPEMWESAA